MKYNFISVGFCSTTCKNCYNFYNCYLLLLSFLLIPSFSFMCVSVLIDTFKLTGSETVEKEKREVRKDLIKIVKKRKDLKEEEEGDGLDFRKIN